MITRLAALACALAALPSLAPSLVQAQSAPAYLRPAAYITCREAHAMAPEARVAWRPSSLSTQHVAAAPEFLTAKPVRQLALLVRGRLQRVPRCLSPDRG